MRISIYFLFAAILLLVVPGSANALNFIETFDNAIYNITGTNVCGASIPRGDFDFNTYCPTFMADNEWTVFPVDICPYGDPTMTVRNENLTHLYAETSDSTCTHDGYVIHTFPEHMDLTQANFNLVGWAVGPSSTTTRVGLVFFSEPNNANKSLIINLANSGTLSPNSNPGTVFSDILPGCTLQKITGQNFRGTEKNVTFTGTDLVTDCGITEQELGRTHAIGFYDDGFEERDNYYINHFEITNYSVSCTPNYVCDGYANSTCLINDTSTASCNSVTDLNSCGETYTGNYSEFSNQTGVCQYCETTPQGCGTGDVNWPEPEEPEEEDEPPLFTIIPPPEEEQPLLDFRGVYERFTILLERIFAGEITREDAKEVQTYWLELTILLIAFTLLIGAGVQRNKSNKKKDKKKKK